MVEGYSARVEDEGRPESLTPMSADDFWLLNSFGGCA